MLTVPRVAPVRGVTVRRRSVTEGVTRGESVAFAASYLLRSATSASCARLPRSGLFRTRARGLSAPHRGFVLRSGGWRCGSGGTPYGTGSVVARRPRVACRRPAEGGKKPACRLPSGTTPWPRDAPGFQPVHAALVASWAVGDEVVRAWCAVEGDRVPAEDVAGWSEAADVEAYLLNDDEGPVAYGELWLDDEEGEVELARLLVAPGRRGHGVGRALTRALTEQAQDTHPELPAVILRVRPENLPAIRCYAAAGFVDVPEDEQASWNQGQRFAYHWMVLGG